MKAAQPSRKARSPLRYRAFQRDRSSGILPGMPNPSFTQYRGACHCGALAVSYRTVHQTLSLRSCQCTFCQRHQARYHSDPHGAVRFIVRRPEALQRYRFGAQTLDFILCSDCGCYLGAMQEEKLACVNVNSWLHPGEASPVDFDSEPLEQRRRRRERGWSPAAVVFCELEIGERAAPLLRAYYEELARVLGDFDPNVGPSASSEEMSSPHGAFLLLSDRERLLACGGLKTHSPGVGEIKRMYIVPEARGGGLGRDLLAELERQARLLGFNRLVLDTATPLEAAASLYRKSGYDEVPPYNDNPYAGRWFSKELNS